MITSTLCRLSEGQDRETLWMMTGRMRWWRSLFLRVFQARPVGVPPSELRNHRTAVVGRECPVWTGTVPQPSGGGVPRGSSMPHGGPERRRHRHTVLIAVGASHGTRRYRWVVMLVPDRSTLRRLFRL